MILTMALVGVGLKWAAALGIGGGGAYGVGRLIGSRMEVELTLGEYGHASRMEVGPPEYGLIGMSHDEVMDAMAAEGEEGDAFFRRLAEESSGSPDDNVVLKARTYFMRHWIDALRLEFPLRENRPSDRAAMSKWLAGQLRQRGVRVRHMADMVPRCVAMALNRSRAEILGDQEAEAARIRTRGGRFFYELRRTLMLDRQALGTVGC